MVALPDVGAKTGDAALNRARRQSGNCCASLRRGLQRCASLRKGLHRIRPRVRVYRENDVLASNTSLTKRVEARLGYPIS